jgi:hypothetical protein
MLSRCSCPSHRQVSGADELRAAVLPETLRGIRRQDVASISDFLRYLKSFETDLGSFTAPSKSRCDRKLPDQVAQSNPCPTKAPLTYARFITTTERHIKISSALGAQAVVFTCCYILSLPFLAASILKVYLGFIFQRYSAVVLLG